MTAFADGDDMIARYDARTLGDLCSDDGTRVAPASIPANTKVTTALSGATGEILAAVRRAGRYSVADLEGLTGESLAYLKDITCAFAWWRLWRRRAYTKTDEGMRKSAYEDYREKLEQLRGGDEVFEVDDVVSAGKPKVETVTRAEIRDQWATFC